MMKSNIRGILSFLSITFGISWIVWGGLYFFGVPLGSPVHSAVGMIAVFSPAIAALIVRH